MRILLADANGAERASAVRNLEGAGASVATAEDIGEALALLARERFDAVVVAGALPGGAGGELIRRLRAMDGHAALTPAFVLADADAPTGAAAEGHGTLGRPLSAEALGDALAARAGGAPEAPRIDLEIYDALRAAVGPDAFGDLLGKVDADIAAAYDRMRGGIADDDAEEVRGATHIMMAVAGAIGATGLQTLSQRLNRAAHDGDAGAIAGIGADAAAEAERVLGFIRQEKSR